MPSNRHSYREQIIFLPCKVVKNKELTPAEATPTEDIAPWSNAELIEENSADFILSQAVLEHVDEIEKVYEVMQKGLKHGGIMSHNIDFSSHGASKQWNGHFRIPDLFWKLMKGNRPYSLNRLPLSGHLNIQKNYGLEILTKITRNDLSDIKREQLAKRFKNISGADLATRGALVISKKYRKDLTSPFMQHA